MGMQDSLYRESKDSMLPEGVPNFNGNFTRGCQIPRGAKFPVTPAFSNASPLYQGLLGCT